MRYVNGHYSRLGLIESDRPRVVPGTLCACGCGKDVPLQQSNGKPRYIRSGDGSAWIYGHQSARGGSASPSWRGGRIVVQGYVKLHIPAHPHARRGYVWEHHVVMARKIGRYLEPGEVVHHRNDIRNDNRLRNLRLLTEEEHKRLHGKAADNLGHRKHTH